MATLPYVTAPGNIEKALKGIKSASTPDSVSQDFVKTILGIPGGSGNQITSFLKKLGFAGSDGTPTDRYTRFRNSRSSGTAVAEALREAYAPLYKRNEYMHELSDDDLKGLVIEETGAAEDSSVPGLVLQAINTLKSFADFKASPKGPEKASKEELPARPEAPFIPVAQQTNGLRLGLSYTVNLNLPATSDIAVFNAIFKSLRENLLRSDNES